MSPMTIARPRRFLCILALIVFALISRGHFSDEDTARRFQVTHWLWSKAPQVAMLKRDLIPRHPNVKNFTIWPGFCDLEGKNGEIYAQFSLGQSLLLLPADLAAAAFKGDLLDKDRSFGMNDVITNYLLFPLIAMACVLLAYELLLELGFASAVALSGAILTLLGTSLLLYVQDNAENSQFFCAFVGALAFILKARKGHFRRNLLVAGALAGFALLMSIPFVAYILPLAALVKMVADESGAPPPRRMISFDGRALSALALFSAPIAFCGLVDRGYQFYRFGEWFGTYMKHCVTAFARVGGYPPGFPFGYDLLAGVTGPFLQLGRAIWIFDPFILVALPLALVNWKSLESWRKRVLVATLVAFVGVSFIYGGSWYWNGGSGSWGPRHHLVLGDVFCLIGFALAAERFSSLGRAWKTAIVAGIALAVAAQLVLLPLPPDLENVQIAFGDPIRVAQFARLRNFYLIATGQLQAYDSGFHDPDLSAVEGNLLDPMSPAHFFLVSVVALAPTPANLLLAIGLLALVVFGAYRVFGAVRQGFAGQAEGKPAIS